MTFVYVVQENSSSFSAAQASQKVGHHDLNENNLSKSVGFEKVWVYTQKKSENLLDISWFRKEWSTSFLQNFWEIEK